MDTESDLKTALTETLENGGVLRSLRAGLRTEILRALEEPRPSEQLPQLPPENCLINELVLEYLSFNNYKRTESILEAESGYRRTCVGRAFLEKELNLAPSEKASRLCHKQPRQCYWLSSNQDSPLLYAIVETLRVKTTSGATEK